MADIIVCGYAIRHPLAGNVLAFAHYVAGFTLLGHRVLYVEESGWELSCYDPSTSSYGSDPTVGLSIFNDALRDLGAPEVPMLYLDRASGVCVGGTRRELEQRLTGADLLVNVGGVCSLDEFERCERRMLIDLDPGFTQAGRFGGPLVADYQTHLTYGANIGMSDCIVSTGAVRWQPTVPPVLIDYWSRHSQPGPASGRLTTIANVDAYGSITVGDRGYGQKLPELRRLGHLPTQVDAVLELAISPTDQAVADELTAAGWRLRDAGGISQNLAGYRRYVTGSAGEFSVAKEAYVGLRTGWFSDRSVCYLAAGLPVIVQDTGFVDRFPSIGGAGILAWRTAAEAEAAIAEVMTNHDTHRQQARRLAAELFDHRVVLPRLLALGA